MFNIYDNGELVAEGLSEGETAQFILDCYQSDDEEKRQQLEDFLYSSNFEFIKLIAKSKMIWRFQGFHLLFEKVDD